MRLRSHLSHWVCLPLVLLLATATFAAPPEEGAAPTAQLKTFAKPSGETFFALSVKPNVAVKPVAAQDVLVLFDTSACQTGLYRKDSLAALETMLAAYPETVRVQLVAIDLGATPLTEGFVAAGGDAHHGGAGELEHRLAPAGADVAAADDAPAAHAGGAVRAERKTEQKPEGGAEEGAKKRV